MQIFIYYYRNWYLDAIGEFYYTVEHAYNEFKDVSYRRQWW